MFCQVFKNTRRLWKMKQIVESSASGLTMEQSRYVNNEFERFLASCGIKHERTVPYTPEQNGVAERVNRTIFDKVRCMLNDSGLDNAYWAEAANTVIYLKNRFTTAAMEGATPEELWSGRKVDLSHLRIFGCIAYAHIPDECRTKLASKSKRYVFVGYSTVTKGYRLMDPRQPKRVFLSRDVVFLEEQSVFERCKEDAFVK